jgi:excisionase family DNA binding protein
MAKHNTGSKVDKHAGEAGSDHLLTVEETAEFLRCSTDSLNKWRISGRGPRFVRVGRRVRYRAADLADFISAFTRSNTSQAAAPP